MSAHISLFSGVGMIDRAAEALGFETIATAEVDPFCRQVLEARFPTASHFDDVRKVKRDDLALLRAQVNRPLLVSGGFPCQPVSLAGYGKVENDPRWLWPEFKRVISEFAPEYVLIENVAALRARGLDTILSDLDHEGYDAWWDCIPAAAVGAPHMRDRIWIQAKRRDQQRLGGDAGDPIGFLLAGQVIAFEDSPGLQKIERLPRAGRMIDARIYQEPPPEPPAISIAQVVADMFSERERATVLRAFGQEPPQPEQTAQEPPQPEQTAKQTANELESAEVVTIRGTPAIHASCLSALQSTDSGGSLREFVGCHLSPPLDARRRRARRPLEAASQSVAHTMVPGF